MSGTTSLTLLKYKLKHVPDLRVMKQINKCQFPKSWTTSDIKNRDGLQWKRHRLGDSQSNIKFMTIEKPSLHPFEFKCETYKPQLNSAVEINYSGHT